MLIITFSYIIDKILLIFTIFLIVKNTNYSNFAKNKLENVNITIKQIYVSRHDIKKSKSFK